MFFKIVEDRFEYIQIQGYVADNGDLYFRGLDVARLLNYANRSVFVASRTKTRLGDVVDDRVLKLPARILNTLVFDQEKTIELLGQATNVNVLMFAEKLDGTHARIVRMDQNEPCADIRRSAVVKTVVKFNDDERDYDFLMDFYVEFREKTFEFLDRLKKIVPNQDLKQSMDGIDFNNPPPILEIAVNGTRLIYTFWGEAPKDM